MSHLDKLEDVQKGLEQYSKALEIRIAQRREENFQYLQKLQHATQHLDRVLQVETRRRQAQQNKIRETLQQLSTQESQKLDGQITAHSDTLQQQLTQFQEHKGTMTQSLQVLQAALTKTFTDWTTAQSQSTARLKQLLDVQRQKRLIDATELQNYILETDSQLIVRKNAWVAQSDQELVNVAVRTATKNKKYEQEMQGGLEAHQNKGRQQLERLLKEKSVSGAQLAAAAKTLEKCVEVAQGSMGQISKFGQQKTVVETEEKKEEPEAK